MNGKTYFNSEEIYKNTNEIESLAIFLEVHDNFKNFNSLEFITRFKRNEISEEEMETFFKLCFFDEQIEKQKKKEAEKIRKKGG